jgi:hypothetical protein
MRPSRCKSARSTRTTTFEQDLTTGEKAMQCLLICCFDEELWAKIPESERDAIMQKYGEFNEDIMKSGHYCAGAKLQQSSAAKTVREKDGKPVVTDGPFAETKEQLGGYHLIECKDLDEAISIAMRIPTIRAGGSVEVRPVESAS